MARVAVVLAVGARLSGEINAIAARHGLPVIEDAAQSFGAAYKGRKSCNLSAIACTSFFPSKPLGCYGDGGAIFTGDDALARAMRENGLSLGRDFQAVSVSFDPAEKPALGGERRRGYLQSLGIEDRKSADWPFLVGSGRATRALADAVGFHYKYDEVSGEWAHVAAILVLTPEGKVSRYLYGVEYPPKVMYGNEIRIPSYLVSSGIGQHKIKIVESFLPAEDGTDDWIIKINVEDVSEEGDIIED